MAWHDVRPPEGMHYPTSWGQPFDEVIRVARRDVGSRKLSVREGVLLALWDGATKTTAQLYAECSPRWRDAVASINNDSEANGWETYIDVSRDPDHPTGYRYRFRRRSAGAEQEALF